MAKRNWDIMIAFSPQPAPGTIPDGTGGSADWSLVDQISGDPNGQDDGLVLGDSESGEGGSGITVTPNRNRRDKAFLTGTFDRPLSDLLNVGIESLTFAWPFSGPKRTTQAVPVEADYKHILGVDTLLQGVGMIGAAGTTSWVYQPGSAVDFAVFLQWFRNRVIAVDCKVSSLSIAFPAGEVPVATAEIQVGSIAEPADYASVVPASEWAAGFPAYGAQLDISTPPAELVGNAWPVGTPKGFSELTVNITPTIDELGDANLDNGRFLDPSDREITVDTQLYADDSDLVYELQQLYVTDAANLSELKFSVGTPAAGSTPATATSIAVPQPEVADISPSPLGSKATNQVSMLARGQGSGNNSLILTNL